MRLHGILTSLEKLGSSLASSTERWISGLIHMRQVLPEVNLDHHRVSILLAAADQCFNTRFESLSFYLPTPEVVFGIFLSVLDSS